MPMRGGLKTRSPPLEWCSSSSSSPPSEANRCTRALANDLCGTGAKQGSSYTRYICGLNADGCCLVVGSHYPFVCHVKRRDMGEIELPSYLPEEIL